MTFLIASTIKISILLLLAFAATALLKNRSAAWRHWVLSIALAAAAVAPLLTLTMPSWHMPALATLPLYTNEFRRAPNPIVGEARPSSVEATQQEPTRDQTPSIARVAVAIWWVGVGCSLFVLVAGISRLGWIAARSRRVRSAAWVALGAEISSQHGLRRPVVLLETDHPTLLATWGVLQSKVIVPADALGWPRERVRAVLAHEIAHVRRRDWLVQIAAEVLRCVYWFNPLVWIACRRIRLEAEQAADEAVLESGVDGVEYAVHLLTVARTFASHRRRWTPAPAIVRPSTLERRVGAMLNTSIDRSPMNRSVRAVIVIALFGAAAAIAAAQGPFASFSGSILDAMNGTLVNATLQLTNAANQSRYEVKSDTAGRFEFVGLPPGEYALEAKFPGFAILRGTLSVSGQNLQRDLVLKVGSLEETVTVRAGQSAAAVRVDASRERLSDAAKRALASPGECKPSAAGGTLRQPAKLDDIRPQYPRHLEDAKVGGTVVLEGVIGTDGTMKDVRVVKPAHPDLDAAAVDALRQWRFSETLLNCVPVDVTMTATMRFLPE
jgi:TonB family protein